MFLIYKITLLRYVIANSEKLLCILSWFSAHLASALRLVKLWLGGDVFAETRGIFRLHQMCVERHHGVWGKDTVVSWKGGGYGPVVFLDSSPLAVE